MTENYSVTVAVLTYHPDENKLLATLRSVLLQKNVAYQIVLADDGSEDPLTDKAQALFRQFGFEDYKLVHNPVNRGTVYNALSAVAAADGTYIKLISPGDMLSAEDALEKWVARMCSTNAHVSCCEALYYTQRGDAIQPVSRRAHPQDTRCYRRKNYEKARYHFLVFDDIFLGAATLCHTETLLAYLQQIAGKIVYGEDNVYRLMAYDRLSMDYFDYAAVVYEVGTGVSTSGSQAWNQRLQKDWDACKRLIFKRPIQVGDVAAENFRKKHSGNAAGKREMFRVKGLLGWKLRQKFFPKMTRCYLPKGFEERIFGKKGR